MKKMEIDVFDYASEIAHGFNNGILLNSRDKKFDTMIIGWGALGVTPHFKVPGYRRDTAN